MIQDAAFVLLDAISAAEVVVNDPSSTPQQITAAVQALQPAVWNFSGQLSTASQQTNDAPLIAAIAAFKSEIPAIAAAASTGDFNTFLDAMSATAGDDQIGAICGF
jgi:hypothetical protein